MRPVILSEVVRGADDRSRRTRLSHCFNPHEHGYPRISGGSGGLQASESAKRKGGLQPRNPSLSPSPNPHNTPCPIHSASGVPASFDPKRLSPCNRARLLSSGFVTGHGSSRAKTIPQNEGL